MIRCLPCPTVYQEKLISGDDSYHGQGPTVKFFEGEVQVSLKPTGSRSPQLQSLGPTEARLVETLSEPQLLPQLRSLLCFKGFILLF